MALSYYGRRILFKKPFLNSQVRTSYVVLVPEIGEDLPDKNPLLHSNGLPEFSNLTIEMCVAAIAKQTNDFESKIREIEKAVESKPDTEVFKNVIDPIEVAGTTLDTTWGLAKTLYLGNQSLMPTKSYLTIHDRARKARSTKFNSKPIFEACKTYIGSENKNLSEEQSRILKKFTVEGKLNGLNLSGTKRSKYMETIQKLNKERGIFKGKLDMATKQFSYVIRDYEIVKDFPTELLKLMAVDSCRIEEGPWKVTLQPHIFNGFMEHCPDRELRWNVWQAYTRRCSGFADKSLQNSTNVEEIRFLRNHIASLLGYENYVQMSMETKMLESVDEVHKTLQTLLDRAKPTQQQEFADLKEFASTNGGFNSQLQHWDIPYWKQQQEKVLFNFNEDKIKEYFPLPTVLNGLFGLCTKLFDITIKERTKIPTWHSDVKYFDIFDNENTANPIAGFYFDPYSREQLKLRLHDDIGYMVGIRNRSNLSDIKPLAALIFNFQSPCEDRPSLLTFNEVKTLFFKFGHALQHLLTRANYSEVAGLSNVEWDAVDVCGHVLSHWLYDVNTMKSLTSHYQNKQQIPQEIITNLIQMRSHLSGMELCNELYLADLDLKLHMSKDFWLDVVKQLWPTYHILPVDKKDSHVCQFSAIFSEEWGAAYYSKIWSQLVAADVYSAFHEVHTDEKQTVLVGKRFRDTFLALGGASHPSQVFRRFRGRDPSPKALMRILGLKKNTSDVKVDNVPVVN